ncbi:MAG TPA: hypothetical protein VMU85_13700, partial [Stellaceae bacterium]|nr:hypothetical protein [Stellaceae bacterium]
SFKTVSSPRPEVGFAVSAFLRLHQIPSGISRHAAAAGQRLNLAKIRHNRQRMLKGHVSKTTYAFGGVRRRAARVPGMMPSFQATTTGRTASRRRNKTKSTRGGYNR